MRIWLAPSAFFPQRGGVEELTAQLGQELQRRGHEVLVVTHRHPADLPAAEEIDGLQVRRVAFTSPARRLAPMVRFVSALRDEQRMLAALTPTPDLVHIQCPSNQTAALTRFTTRRHLPLVLTTQGEVVMDAGRIYQRSRYLRLVLRAAAKRASALTACSQWAAGEAAKFAPEFALAEPILNGVNPAEWVTGPAPDEPVACAWGRHVPQKGFDLLLRAWPEVRRQLPQARLLIGGSGPETPMLQQLADDSVEFLGPLDRSGVREMLDRSRVAVVPSRLEPFGIVAVEALAAGRNVVYSAVGGLHEAAADRGIAVNPEDTSALSAAIAEALLAPSDEDANRHRASQLSWAAITHAYLDVYERALSRVSSTRR